MGCTCIFWPHFGVTCLAAYSEIDSKIFFHEAITQISMYQPFPHISICFTSVTPSAPHCCHSLTLEPLCCPQYTHPSIHPSIDRLSPKALTQWGHCLNPGHTQYGGPSFVLSATLGYARGLATLLYLHKYQTMVQYSVHTVSRVNRGCNGSSLTSEQ